MYECSLVDELDVIRVWAPEPISPWKSSLKTEKKIPVNFLGGGGGSTRAIFEKTREHISGALAHVCYLEWRLIEGGGLAGYEEGMI